jgi:NAD(P)-dependent dehydrogenase (short-subunit alcohol dehydrogenase family)
MPVSQATLSAEFAPRISVNGIAPGVVPTEISRKALSVETEEDLAAVEAKRNILGPMTCLVALGDVDLFGSGAQEHWWLDEV